MKFNLISGVNPLSLLPILFGIIAFIGITGGDILLPTNVNWLMHGDPMQHWLGWQFFRHSPLLQWPLGANPEYGLDISSSIVFTDSIPLFALIFKYLRFLLPDTFQYFGLWILSCFILQAFFSWKLISLFSNNKWLPLIGSVFFTLSPIFLWRLEQHMALSGQWVILAGLYFYFSKNHNVLAWLGLLIITILIHAYLLVMVAAIGCADLLQRIWNRQIQIRTGLMLFFAGTLLITAVMWAAGYFMINNSVSSGGYGHFRMNLLSVFDPDENWSLLLNDIPGGEGDYEGFNYLGLGMLLLAILAGYEFFCCGISRFSYSRISPVVLLSAGLFLFAISNHIAIGGYEIFSYHLPPMLESLAQIFRASGRFFWPVYYLIYLLIFYIIATKMKPGIALAICLLMLVVQLTDASKKLHLLHDKFSQQSSWSAWSSPLISPLWDDLAKYYKNIIYVLPENSPPNWMALSDFAAKHRMGINAGYFARVSQSKLDTARDKIQTSITHNIFTPGSLYVFSDDALWNNALNKPGARDLAGELDGIRIYAPLLRDCQSCKSENFNDIFSDASPVYFDFSFKKAGNGTEYLKSGWSLPESWGIWSEGNQSEISLMFEDSISGEIELFIEGFAFLHENHTLQEIDLYINNQFIKTLKYSLKKNGPMKRVKIPENKLSRGVKRLDIMFKLKNTKAPAELGISDDVRRLGLGLVSLRIRQKVMSVIVFQ
jgi:hypothetical protein